MSTPKEIYIPINGGNSFGYGCFSGKKGSSDNETYETKYIRADIAEEMNTKINLAIAEIRCGDEGTALMILESIVKL